MNKKNKKNSEKKELLTISQLAKALGVRASTIKYYTRIGILPFEQEEERLWRYYNKKEVLKRLNEIKKLKKKLSMEEIIEYFKNKKKR